MWLDGKVDDVVTVQQRVFDVERLFDSQPAVVMSIDDHILFLIGYPVQGDLLSFVVGGEQVVQHYDCHIFAGVFRWQGILITAVRDEAVFCIRRRLILSMIYSRLRGLRPSFFSLSKGISFVVACTFPLTLLHQARAWPVKIVQGVVPDANHKIVPDELYRALDLAFCLAPVWKAQHRPEPIEAGKVLELPVQSAVLLL